MKKKQELKPKIFARLGHSHKIEIWFQIGSQSNPI